MMTRILNVKVWAAAVAVLATTVSLGAQTVPPPTPPPPPQGQATTQTPPQTDRPAALQTQTIDKYIVGRAKPPEVPGSPIVDMTIEQAFAIALDKNLELQSAKLNPTLQDYTLRQLRASFNPRFTGSYNYNNSKTTSENTLEGVSRITTLNQTYRGGMSQSLPWFGSSYSANFNSGRRTNNALNTRLNPSLSASLSANFSMPLLAGFQIDQNRNNLRTAPIQRQIVDIQLQQTIERTKSSVRNAYWTLRQAIEQIEIAKLGLEMANRQLNDTRARIEIGTVAQIDAAQPELTVANQQQALLNAEISWKNAELAFKRFLVTGVEDDLYKATINPIDSPTATPPQAIDVAAAIQTAISQRSDVAITQRNLEVSRLGLEISKNALLPNLSFTTDFSAAGSGGNVLNNGVIVTPGGYGDALRAITNLDTPQFSMGFSFTYPLGMAAAKASYAQAQIRLEQAKIAAKGDELTIQTEVTRFALNVENTYRQYEAAQKARVVAERALEAELTRFDVGMSNNFTVAQQQQAVTNQRLTELSRLIAYANALADFERALKFPG
jgi:outer membrane protein TolC